MDKELTIKLLEDTEKSLQQAIGGMLILKMDTHDAIRLAYSFMKAKKAMIDRFEIEGDK